MSDVTFTPSSWTHAAERMEETRLAFQADTQSTLFPEGGPSGGGIFGMLSSPIDQELHSQDARVALEWFDGVGNMVEKFNSDASKLSSTAGNYQETSNSSEYVVRRYWSY